MSTASDCYGKLFPELPRLETNRPMVGKAFTARRKTVGLGLIARTVEVDAAQWDKCVACDRYRHCYDLSLAKLLLMHVLAL